MAEVKNHFDKSNIVTGNKWHSLLIKINEFFLGFSPPLPSFPLPTPSTASRLNEAVEASWKGGGAGEVGGRLRGIQSALFKS